MSYEEVVLDVMICELLVWCSSYIMWKYHPARHDNESRRKLNSTKEETILGPFQSELLLVHRLKYCTKGVSKRWITWLKQIMSNGCMLLLYACI